jgi:hypothetical protein
MRRLPALLVSFVLITGGWFALPAAVQTAQAAAPAKPKVTPGYPIRSQQFSVTGKIPVKVARPVELQQQVGSKWKRVASGRTTASGGYTFTTSVSAASVNLRVFAAKIKIGKLTYAQAVSKTSSLRTVSVIPAAPLSGETFRVAETLPYKVVRSIVLQRKVGSKWLQIASAKTSKTGAFSFTASLPTSSDLRFVAPKVKIKSKTYKQFTSASFRVTLAAQSGTIAMPSGAETGQALTATLHFVPTRAGRVVELQQLVGDSWQSVATGAEAGDGSATLAVTPTETGTFTFRAVAAASQGAASFTTATTSVEVSSGTPAPSIVSDSLPTAVSGETYSATLAAAGGTSPYTWSATGLPAGVTLDADTGELAGTPTAAGTHAVKLTLTDADAATSSKSIDLVVRPVVGIAGSRLPNAVVGESYDTNLSGSGGTEPYSWSATDLPSWLTLDPDGHLSGIATDVGDQQVTLTIEDGHERTATKSLTLTVGAAVSITTPSLADAIAGEPYSATLAAEGGTSPYSWATSPLPSGLTLDTSTGRISGTPAAAGVSTVTATVTDDHGTTNSAALDLTVKAHVQLVTASLPDGVVGKAYTATLSATDGTGPYTWSATGLPEGLSLAASSGQITGTPTAVGATTATVQVTDQHGSTASATLGIQVYAVFGITTDSLPDGVLAESYNATLGAVGGAAPYTWSTDGLPAGITLDPATGKLSGTPTSAGQTEVEVTVTDGNTRTATKAVLITIHPEVGITTVSLPDGVVDEHYSTTLVAEGGTEPYTWAGDGFPEGLMLNTVTGEISGNPTEAAVLHLEVTVFDDHGHSDTVTLTLVVKAVVGITSADLPTATAGVSYETLLTATGGTEPYTWSAVGLPEGLNLAEDGVLSGTTDEVGDFTVSITVSDSDGHTTNKNFTVTVSSD